MRMFNLKLSTQVYVGFAAIGALLVGISVSAWVNFQNVEAAFQRLNTLTEVNGHMVEAEAAFFRARLDVRAFEGSLAPADRTNAQAQMAASAKHLEALDASVDGDKKKIVDGLKTALRQYGELTNKTAEMQIAANADGNRIYSFKVTPVFQPIQEAANLTVDQTIIGFADESVRSSLNAKVAITRYLDTQSDADFAEMQGLLKDVRKLLGQLSAKATDQNVLKAVAAAVAFLDGYEADLAKFKAMMANVQGMRRERQAFAQRLGEDAIRFGTALKNEQDALSKVAFATMQQSRSFLLGISAVSLVLAVGFAMFIGRRISRPLSLVAGVIDDIAAHKDLVQRVQYDAANEVGRITKGFNELMGNLHDAFEGIARNTRQVAAAAGQASAAVGQVSDGSQNQLNAINQISAAMEQTARAITDVAGNTDSATANARKAAEMVEHGREKMAAMLQVANTISDNSKKINQITDVISRIANQTNMLSLNAAIEAARAGEHGKGFAVVAEEVRKLAEHAATSVQQITELVEHAAGEAQRSLEMVNAVNGDMESIAESVRRSDAMVQSIAAAMTQQSSSVEEISTNIKNLNKIGETNAAAAEEITATMVELARLADQTRGQMEQFRI